VRSLSVPRLRRRASATDSLQPARVDESRPGSPSGTGEDGTIASRRAAWAAAGLTTDAVLNRVLEIAVATWADLPALMDLTDPCVPHRTLSYRDLSHEVSELAGFLDASGVQPGDFVLVQSPNCAEVLVTLWGIWHVGAVAVPVVDMYRAHEMQEIVRAVQPVAVLCSDEHRGNPIRSTLEQLLDDQGCAPHCRVLLQGNSPGWIPWEQAKSGGHVPRANVAADDPALVLFTSGTTSRPKGVVHSSRTLLAEARQIAVGWGLGWRDRVHLPLPIAHVTGIEYALTIPATTGGSVVLSRMSGLRRAAQEIIDCGVTWASGKPELLKLVADGYRRAGVADPPLRSFTSGGSNMARDLDEVSIPGVRPFRVYGMTELPSVTATNAAANHHVRLETDGRIAPGVECEAVDPETRCALGPGIEGELRVRGPEMMVRYLDPDHQAAQVDDEGWFYTGDLGMVDEERCVTITGRTKDIINRGGEKFSARDVEELLLRHPAVAQAAVAAVADDRYGEVPAAFLVARDAQNQPEPEAMVDFLFEAQIARPKIPVYWDWVDALPMTPTGKVRKAELLERPLPAKFVGPRQ
jgi:acyl-CoA synthetase (AMP-forming)/AMP-acid ligase II